MKKNIFGTETEILVVCMYFCKKEDYNGILSKVFLNWKKRKENSNKLTNHELDSCKCFRVEKKVWSWNCVLLKRPLKNKMCILKIPYLWGNVDMHCTLSDVYCILGDLSILYLSISFNNQWNMFQTNINAKVIPRVSLTLQLWRQICLRDRWWGSKQSIQIRWTTQYGF